MAEIDPTRDPLLDVFLDPAVAGRDYMSESTDVMEQAAKSKSVLTQTSADLSNALGGYSAFMKETARTEAQSLAEITRQREQLTKLDGNLEIVNGVMSIFDPNYSRRYVQSKILTETSKLNTTQVAKENARVNLSTQLNLAENQAKTALSQLGIEGTERDAANLRLEAALNFPGKMREYASNVFNSHSLRDLQRWQQDPKSAPADVKDLVARQPGALDNIVTIKKSGVISLDAAEIALANSKAKFRDDIIDRTLSGIPNALLNAAAANPAGSEAAKILKAKVPGLTDNEIAASIEQRNMSMKAAELSLQNAANSVASGDKRLEQENIASALKEFSLSQLQGMVTLAGQKMGAKFFTVKAANGAEVNIPLEELQSAAAAKSAARQKSLDLAATSATQAAEARSIVENAETQASRVASIGRQGPTNPNNKLEGLPTDEIRDLTVKLQTTKAALAGGSTSVAVANAKELAKQIEGLQAKALARIPEGGRAAVEEYIQTGRMSSANAFQYLPTADLEFGVSNSYLARGALTLQNAITNRVTAASLGTETIGQVGTLKKDNTKGGSVFTVEKPKEMVPEADIRKMIKDMDLDVKFNQRNLEAVMIATVEQLNKEMGAAENESPYSIVARNGVRNSANNDKDGKFSNALMFENLTKASVTARQEGLIGEDDDYSLMFLQAMKKVAPQFVDQALTPQTPEEVAYLQVLNGGQTLTRLNAAIQELQGIAQSTVPQAEAAFTREVAEKVLREDMVNRATAQSIGQNSPLVQQILPPNTPSVDSGIAPNLLKTAQERFGIKPVPDENNVIKIIENIFRGGNGQSK
jgi:hypothetical protein